MSEQVKLPNGVVLTTHFVEDRWSEESFRTGDGRTVEIVLFSDLLSDLPKIIAQRDAEWREALLSEEVIAELQGQLSSEGWMLEGHPAYDASERSKAQDILGDALEAAIDHALPHKENGGSDA